LVEELIRHHLLHAKSFGDIDYSWGNVDNFFMMQYVPRLITELDNSNKMAMQENYTHAGKNTKMFLNYYYEKYN
jgi:hypothetical protein